jgi:hypothetical protein
VNKVIASILVLFSSALTSHLFRSVALTGPGLPARARQPAGQPSWGPR